MNSDILNLGLAKVNTLNESTWKFVDREVSVDEPCCFSLAQSDINDILRYCLLNKIIFSQTLYNKNKAMHDELVLAYSVVEPGSALLDIDQDEIINFIYSINNCGKREENTEKFIEKITQYIINTFKHSESIQSLLDKAHLEPWNYLDEEEIEYFCQESKQELELNMRRA